MDTTTAAISTAALDDPATAVLGLDYAEPDAMYPDWRGINYDPAMTIKDVAAVVRRELRRAVKAGTLGTATAVSVRYRTASMMQAIDVTITVPKRYVDANTPGAIQAEDRWGDRTWVVPDGHGVNGAAIQRIEPGARDAKAKVEAFLTTFTYNRSNVQVDYFDRRFYGDVTLVEER